MSGNWIIVYIKAKFAIHSINHYAILSKELKISHGYQYNTQFALDDALLEADVLTGWLNPPFRGYVHMPLRTNAKMQCTPQYSPHTHEYIWRYISYYQSSFSTVSPDNTSCNFFFFFKLEVLFYLAMVDWDFHLSCIIAYLCLETYCCCCC